MPVPAQIAIRTYADFYLAEVAADAGSSDQSRFCRPFKRMVGVTPGQFRTPTLNGARRAGSAHGRRLPLMSNCKPSLLNVLPFPVGLHFEIKNFEANPSRTLRRKSNPERYFRN
jgi:hypothetical protein